MPETWSILHPDTWMTSRARDEIATPTLTLFGTIFIRNLSLLESIMCKPRRLGVNIWRLLNKLNESIKLITSWWTRYLFVTWQCLIIVGRYSIIHAGCRVSWTSYVSLVSETFPLIKKAYCARLHTREVINSCAPDQTKTKRLL